MERGRRAKQNDAQSMTRGTKDPQGQEAGSLRMVGLAWAGHICGLRFTPFHPILPTPGRQGQSAKAGDPECRGVRQRGEAPQPPSGGGSFRGSSEGKGGLWSACVLGTLTNHSRPRAASQCVDKSNDSPPPSTAPPHGACSTETHVAHGLCEANMVPKNQDYSYSKSPGFRFLFKT